MGPFHCLVLLFSLYRAAAAAEDWCYESQKCHNPGCKEPRRWAEVSPACGGKSQSPINIVTRNVETDWDLQPFEFVNYQDKQIPNWTITNTGHSVQVNLDGSAKITGGLPGRYKAVQFHFHWGRGTNKSHDMEPGSEHSIDGERYAMELHIVHIKEEYPNTSVAAANGGIAVLGFFVEIGNENSNYSPLISKLQDVASHGDEDTMPPLPLSSLIPKKEALTKYYRYTGSLTTPGCSEGVIWTLFEEPIQLSLTQVQEFWMKLYFNKTDNLPMEDNFRPVRPLGDRKVSKSDSAALVSPAKTLLLLPAATYLLLAFVQ